MNLFGMNTATGMWSLPNPALNASEQDSTVSDERKAQIRYVLLFVLEMAMKMTHPSCPISPKRFGKPSHHCWAKQVKASC